MQNQNTSKNEGSNSNSLFDNIVFDVNSINVPNNTKFIDTKKLADKLIKFIKQKNLDLTEFNKNVLNWTNMIDLNEFVNKPKQYTNFSRVEYECLYRLNRFLNIY